MNSHPQDKHSPDQRSSQNQITPCPTPPAYAPYRQPRPFEAPYGKDSRDGIAPSSDRPQVRIPPHEGCIVPNVYPPFSGPPPPSQPHFFGSHRPAFLPSWHPVSQHLDHETQPCHRPEKPLSCGPSVLEDKRSSSTLGQATLSVPIHVGSVDALPPQAQEFEADRAFSTRSNSNRSLLALAIETDPKLVVYQMIVSSPDQRLQLGEIYAAFEDMYPLLRNCEPANREIWRGAVRGLLTKIDCFKRTPGPGTSKHGDYWSIEAAIDNRPQNPKPQRQPSAVKGSGAATAIKPGAQEMDKKGARNPEQLFKLDTRYGTGRAGPVKTTKHASARDAPSREYLPKTILEAMETRGKLPRVEGMPALLSARQLLGLDPIPSEEPSTSEASDRYNLMTRWPGGGPVQSSPPIAVGSMSRTDHVQASQRGWHHSHVPQHQPPDNHAAFARLTAQTEQDRCKVCGQLEHSVSATSGRKETGGTRTGKTLKRGLDLVE